MDYSAKYKHATAHTPATGYAWMIFAVLGIVVGYMRLEDYILSNGLVPIETLIPPAVLLICSALCLLHYVAYVVLGLFGGPVARSVRKRQLLLRGSIMKNRKLEESADV